MNEQDLICFARCVLATLEGYDEWDVDTLDEIAGDAIELGLAFTNDYGLFEAKKAPTTTDEETAE